MLQRQDLALAEVQWLELAEGTRQEQQVLQHS